MSLIVNEELVYFRGHSAVAYERPMNAGVLVSARYSRGSGRPSVVRSSSKTH